VQVTAASLPPPLPEEKLSECQLNRVLVFGDYHPGDQHRQLHEEVIITLKLRTTTTAPLFGPLRAIAAATRTTKNIWAWASLGGAGKLKKQKEEEKKKPLPADSKRGRLSWLTYQPRSSSVAVLSAKPFEALPRRACYCSGVCGVPFDKFRCQKCIFKVQGPAVYQLTSLGGQKYIFKVQRPI
jgi:hypothetical protein